MRALTPDEADFLDVQLNDEVVPADAPDAYMSEADVVMGERLVARGLLASAEAENGDEIFIVTDLGVLALRLHRALALTA